MNRLTVETRDGRTAFRPGDEIHGVASWALDEDPKKVELRLFWHTEGRGAPDFGVVETVAFDGPGREDRRDFRVRAPAAPYSFSGQLVSLRWAVEVVAEPGALAGLQRIAISPTESEIVLTALPD